ncbi:MAG: DNA/RNA nuclease SfsA [Candidatus Heimdallarchaeaceae archaeon]
MKLEENYLIGRFCSRPNRFLAIVKIEETKETVKAHVPDPGRLLELLVPNAQIILRREDNLKRKTQFSVVGVKNDSVWVNIDSQIANRLFRNEFQKIADFEDYEILCPEFKYASSRFDFLLENRKTRKKALVEIKSVTLVENQKALFPDAVTRRGTRHVKELTTARKEEGYESFIVFIVKREDALLFSPNWERDKNFAETLLKASAEGVKIIAVNCIYNPKEGELLIKEKLPTVLD